MSKTLLHIGFHKTGTTALQWFLANNRERLNNFGISYPDFRDFDASVREEGHFHFAKLLAESEENVYPLKKFLSACSNDSSTLVISAESMVRHVASGSYEKSSDARTDYIDRIKNSLPSGEITVVASLRNPYKLIESYYQEFLKKTFFTGTLDNYLNKFFTQYDPLNTLFAWGDIFTNVSLRSYEEDLKHEKGIVGAFFEQVDQSFKPESSAPHKNVSLSKLSCDILAKINYLLQSEGKKTAVLNELHDYSSLKVDEGVETLWTKETAFLLEGKFLNDFESLEKRFNTELSKEIPYSSFSKKYTNESLEIVTERLSKHINFADLKDIIYPLFEKCSDNKRSVKEALKVSKSPSSKLGAESSYGDNKCWPHFSPSFKFNRDSKIFPIGSCFARNIEEYLVSLNLNVPTASFKAPKSEWPGRPSGILNKYSPTAIRQAVEWAAGIFYRDKLVSESDLDSLSFYTKSENVVDLQLASFIPVSKERHLQRRNEIYNLYSEVFSSDVITMTLGMTETWHDKETGKFIDAAPMTKELLSEKDRFEFVNLTATQSATEILRAIEVIKQINSKAKFVITVSPVPLLRTFSGNSQVIANCYSKSTLRSACELITSSISPQDIVYFPSYEIVTTSKSWDFWQKDLQHIKSGGVAQLVKYLLTAMMEGLTEDELDKISARAFSSKSERFTALSYAEKVALKSGQETDIQHYEKLKNSF